MDVTQYKSKGKLDNKHLLTLKDYSINEIYEILQMSAKLKAKALAGKKTHYLKDKTLAMIFAKSSTRTRVSFEQGIKQLGGSAMLLNTGDIQLGRGETIADTARVLSRYNIDGVMIRTFAQKDVEDLARYGDFTVINGLTDDYHPCQALADLFTIYENFGKLNGLKLAYFGDGTNVAHSLMIGGAKTGMEIVICSPQNCKPKDEILDYAKKFGNCSVTDDIKSAAKDADIIYTDVFFSMGQHDNDSKLSELMPYQVNSDLMKLANKHAIFMHCLPAHRGQEVTDEVIDSVQSVVFAQAENRLHAQKAVMYLLMK